MSDAPDLHKTSSIQFEDGTEKFITRLQGRPKSYGSPVMVGLRCKSCWLFWIVSVILVFSVSLEDSAKHFGWQMENGHSSMIEFNDSITEGHRLEVVREVADLGRCESGIIHSQLRGAAGMEEVSPGSERSSSFGR